MGKQQLVRPYKLAIIAVGAGLTLFSAAQFSAQDINPRFLWLAAVTIIVGSRITISIPRAQGEVSVSDTFIFLTILLFGREEAVLLAAADGLCSTLRFCRKPLTVLFNGAVMACSTFLAASALYAFLGSGFNLQGGRSASFVLAVCVIALVQYIVNSGLVSASMACSTGQPLWPTWRNHFLWTSITYFAGATAAGIIAKLVGVVGLYSLLAVTPIVAILYFTYSTYLKNIQSSITQAEQAERHMMALRESEEYFRSAFHHAAGMAVVAPDGRWVKVNSSLCEMLGYTEPELLATSFQAITYEDDLAAVLAEIDRLLEGQVSSFQVEQRYVHKCGHAMWILLSVTKVSSPHAGPTNLIFQAQDITDRKRAEQQLQHDAFHDTLTGLPNRALFIDHLKLAIQRARRHKDHLYAVLFLDLDRFKIINDSLGHMAGDQLLIEIANRLRQCLRPCDMVARLGGDEFTVLIEGLESTDAAREVAELLQAILSMPLALDGHEVYTTISTGIALSTTGYDRPEDVLRDADTAMYRAKALGKARHEVFDKHMHDRALNLLRTEADLRRAVEREEFILHYQPILCLTTGTIAGFEALVRWQHPERGFMSPGEFIPVAEEMGLINQIGQWVLGEACRQARRWREEFPQHPPLQVSVNLSSRQFMKPDLIEQVRRVLRETGLDPHSLKLEITESMVMENLEVAIRTLQQLRGLGIELSIDDFGTGYSSLSYLPRFPISTLKIDRSFVSQMSDNNDNAEIVRTIIMLARNLKMDTVAEGVETSDQLARLKELECEYGQGYLFSKPTDAEGVIKLLAQCQGHLTTLTPVAAPTTRGIKFHASL